MIPVMGWKLMIRRRLAALCVGVVLSSNAACLAVEIAPTDWSEGSRIILLLAVLNQCDLDWRLVGPEHWPCYQRELNRAAAGGAAGAPVSTASSPIAGIFNWAGTVLAPNGFIYAIPFTQTAVMKIDPATDSFSTFATGLPMQSWAGGVLGLNGKIYGIPNAATTVLEIDPETDTVSSFGTLSATPAKWRGGVVAPNGKIFAAPVAAGSVLEIDPVARTVTTFGSLPTVDQYGGCALGADGRIYCLPRENTQIMIIDPETRAISFTGVFSAGSKWTGAVIAPSGKIYGLPYSANAALEFDTITSSSREIGGLSAGTNRYGGAVYSADGRIHGIARDRDESLLLDPVNGTLSVTGSTPQSGTIKWFGGTLAPNGKIYAAPFGFSGNAGLLIIDTKARESLDTNVLLSSYFNKF